jgi:hypothetical protein
MLSARLGTSTPRKSCEAAMVSPSMKWSTADPSVTPVVASATAIRSGCTDVRVVTSPKRPVQ